MGGKEGGLCLEEFCVPELSETQSWDPLAMSATVWDGAAELCVTWKKKALPFPARSYQQV